MQFLYKVEFSKAPQFLYKVEFSKAHPGLSKRVKIPIYHASPQNTSQQRDIPSYIYTSQSQQNDRRACLIPHWQSYIHQAGTVKQSKAAETNTNRLFKVRVSPCNVWEMPSSDNLEAEGSTL